MTSCRSRALGRGFLIVLTFLFFPLSAAPILVGCGARTGLDEASYRDAGLPAAPSSDVATLDEESSVAAEAGIEDATLDSMVDEGIPPVHVSPPVVTMGCTSTAPSAIFVISRSATLMRFDPPSTFTTIGQIACQGNGTPNSMAVDHNGNAYVSFDTGALFVVSTTTAACKTTSFASGQEGFALTFGMGFSADATSQGETLYVAGDLFASSLASIDTSTFRLSTIGAFNPVIDEPELTGTGAGDLFAFYALGNDSAIGKVDKNTARVTEQSLLPGVTQGSSWAFAFLGGDFYTFTAPMFNTVVTRFRPADGSIVQLAISPEPITGAGVSTCAPQQ